MEARAAGDGTERAISGKDLPADMASRRGAPPRTQTRLGETAPPPLRDPETPRRETGEPPILSVADLSRVVAGVIEDEPVLRDVWVRGEVSNFRAYGSSGHWYFTLKDEDSQIPAVCFRGDNARIPFEPEDGLGVLARGRVEVYRVGGRYQLIVRDMKPEGAGVLAVRFEQLKRRLAEEGLFEEDRKKALPPLPQRVGIVTSMQGAAVRDIVTVARRRFPGIKLIVRGVRVQGEGSAAEIASAMRLFNANDAADVLIVGRGGGSIEDLWAFNEELVVRAIAESRIPVVSAVGHETDFTLADFAADERAPTPSAAAERVVPDARELANLVVDAQFTLQRALESRVALARERLLRLAGSVSMKRPDRILAERQQRVDDARERLRAGWRLHEERGRARLGRAASLLDSLSPLAVLSRGFAVAFREGGDVLRRAADARPRERLRLKLKDGDVRVQVEDSS